MSVYYYNTHKMYSTYVQYIHCMYVCTYVFCIVIVVYVPPILTLSWVVDSRDDHYGSDEYGGCPHSCDLKVYMDVTLPFVLCGLSRISHVFYTIG